MTNSATRARRLRRALVLFLVALGVKRARAQTISVSGNPAAMKVTTAVAGLAPTAVSNAATTYSYVQPSGTRHITAHINSAMPAGLMLTVTLAALPSSTSAGAVVLTTVSQTVVSSIVGAVNATRSITYQFSATAAAGVVASQTRTVTFTITAGP